MSSNYDEDVVMKDVDDSDEEDEVSDELGASCSFCILSHLSDRLS